MKKVQFFVFLAITILAISLIAGCSSSSTSTTPTNNPPSAPTQLALAQSVRNAIGLNWTPGSTDADTFRIQRSTDGTTWALLSISNASTHVSSDATILANRTYWYEVRAENSYGASAYCTPASIWTWPAIYAFATDQTGKFIDYDSDGGQSYHTWAWDQSAGAGKVTITTPDASQHNVAVVADTGLADNKMPHEGWYESMIKIGQWYSQVGQASSDVGIFVERDPYTSGDAVGILFRSDSVKFGYYLAGDTFMRILAGPPTIPLLTDNAWHTIRFFHEGQNWTLYIDGSSVWNGAIPNVAISSNVLYQEWDFSRGDGPNNQAFWMDNVANANSTPTPGLLDAVPSIGTRPVGQPPARKM